MASATVVRGALLPLRGLAGSRRLVVMNRWPELPEGLTMADLAAGHAEAIRLGVGAPVDVLGVSTGGSIAQQLAADHPDVVARLVLVSTACRLGPLGRHEQAETAELLERGQTRAASALVVRSFAPRRLGAAFGAVGWAVAHRLFPAASVGDLVATIHAEDAFDLARLAPIEARTLIVAGDRDAFYTRELFEETASLIPQSRLELIPDRGHISVQRDRRALDAIAAFLS